jgi:hypothetical protein
MSIEIELQLNGYLAYFPTLWSFFGPFYCAREPSFRFCISYDMTIVYFYALKPRFKNFIKKKSINGLRNEKFLT